MPPQLPPTNYRRHSFDTFRNESDPEHPTVEEDDILYTYQENRPPATHPRKEPETSRQRIENIVNRIRLYLSDRRYRLQSEICTAKTSRQTIIERSKSQLPERDRSHLENLSRSDDWYLVTTANIAGILDIVITGLRDPERATRPESMPLNFFFCKAWKPVLQAKCIAPTKSCPADATTTTYCVMPCFTAADGVERPQGSYNTRSSPHRLTNDNGDTSHSKGKAADLYYHGIDAHISATSRDKTPSPDEVTSSELPTCPFVEEENSLAHFPDCGDTRPCNTNACDNSHVNKLGRSIGSASHRRIISKPIDHERHSDPDNTILKKLRRYSFLPLTDLTPESVRQDAASARLSMEPPIERGLELRRMSKGILQEILTRSDSLKERSRRVQSSSSAVASRSPRKQARKSEVAPWRKPCLEDSNPHICMDEQETPPAGQPLPRYEE
ncbi:hypothetical protein F5Y16DRAFT_424555 [Xylariaceae sp. FL0255]|nr:hypothetical protein F5Y16DRAFT_424555 [Xylariaceae sp. FL0255]